jgi:hypothetical protein
LAISLLLGYRAALDMENRNTDFDLYYYGGTVERSSTYTDTDAVLALARDAGRAVAPEGVYGSPTLVGLVYQPLSWLDLEMSQTVFAVLALALFAVAVRRAAGDKWWPVWFGLAALSTSNILAFSLGNFAIVTTALILFAFGSLRDDKPRQAGVALGFAIAFKLYPAFLLLPLVVKRQWNAVVPAVVTAAILFAVTPFLLGWTSFMDAIRQTLDIASFVHPWSDNAGIPGTVLRATDDQTLAQWTGRIAMGLSVVLVWGLRRRPLPILFALTTLLMCLSQGISWNMYYGVILVGVLAIRPLDVRPVFWASLAVSYFLACGFLLMSTYRLFDLPRGMPITIGLACFAALQLAAVVTKKPATSNS